MVARHARTLGVAKLVGVLGFFIAACASNPTSVAKSEDKGAECNDLSPLRSYDSQTAADCRRYAAEASTTIQDSATAYYHAAKATLLSMQTDESRIAAARLAEDSINRLPLGSLVQPSNLNRKDRKTWPQKAATFDFERMLLLAETYSDIADIYARNAASFGADIPCQSRDDCLSEALDVMSEGKKIIVFNRLEQAYPKSDPSLQPKFNRYHLLLGQLYESRKFAQDVDKALDSYEIVLLSGSTDPSALEARQSLERLGVEAGARLLDSSMRVPSESDRRRAISYFERVLEANNNNKDAWKAQGDAALALAASRSNTPEESERYFQLAVKSFEEAARAANVAANSAGASPAAIRSEQARALHGQGAARTDWANFLETQNGAADQVQISLLREQAIKSLEDAVAVNPAIASDQTTIRYLEDLAQAYLARDKFEQADAAYWKIIATYIGENRDTYRGPQSWTEADIAAFQKKVRDSRNGAVVAPYLLAVAKIHEEAAAASPNQPTLPGGDNRLGGLLRVVENSASYEYSIKVGLDLAQFFIDKGDFASANARLTPIRERIGRDNNPKWREERIRVFYLSSIAVDRMTSQGVQWAENAVKMGGGEQKYRTQACLAHILHGSTSVRAEGSESWCASTPGPEGKALYGMFYLRRAQHYPYPTSKNLRSVAYSAFQQGLAEISAEDYNKPPSFGWRSATQAPLPTLRHIMIYGGAQMAACEGVQQPVSLSESEIRATQKFFTDYQVESCSN